MLLLFGMLGYFSIPSGEFSLNPFSGEGFNALAIRNNLRVISQLGIVAMGAGLLIISGEFDLSIGSMIGFAGGVMAMILRWGFAVVIPYVSFEGGIHIETFTLFKITDVSPLLAVSITLCFTLFFGWLQGFIIVRSGLASFIVTLGGLFFLRGLTEIIYRAFNKRPDQTAGSTTVTEIPDIKNIVNVPGHGELEREVAKSLPQADLLELLKTIPETTVLKITEKLTYINESVAASKNLLLKNKGVKGLEKSLENALSSGNEGMVAILQDKIANFQVEITSPRIVSDVDIAKEYIDTLHSARPVATFFGGVII